MSNYGYDPLATGEKSQGQTRRGAAPPYQAGPGSFSASAKSKSLKSGAVELGKSAPTVNVGKVMTKFFQDHPMSITCRNCQETVITETRRVANSQTWCLCTAIFFLGGFLGCCLIPFCTDRFRDLEHSCPECGVVLGRCRS